MGPKVKKSSLRRKNDEQCKTHIFHWLEMLSTCDLPREGTKTGGLADLVSLPYPDEEVIIAIIRAQLSERTEMVVQEIEEFYPECHAMYESFMEGCSKDLPFTPAQEPSWAHTLLALFLLLELAKEYDHLSRQEEGTASGGSKAPADILSMNEQVILRSVISFVFPLGVAPFLHPAVRDPVLSCSKFKRSPALIKHTLTDKERQTFLSVVVLNLLRLRGTECLWLHVCFKHLMDLILALTQLGWGPGADQTTAKLYKEVFSSFVENAAPPPMMVEALMMERTLGFTKQNPPPKWLFVVTTQFLNRILLGPNGAHAVMWGFLDPTGSDLETQTEEKCRTLAGVFIGMIPKLARKRSWEIICSQFLSLLNTEKRKSCYSILRIIHCTMFSLYSDQKHRESTEKHFFMPLFAPLQKLCEVEMPSDFVLNEAVLTACLNRIHSFYYPSYPTMQVSTPHLVKHLNPLMYIGGMARHLRSPLEPLTRDLISYTLSSLHIEGRLEKEILPSFLHVDQPHSATVPRLNANLKITMGPLRGLVVSASQESPWLHQDPTVITQLLVFVRKIGVDALCDLFLQMILEGEVSRCEQGHSMGEAGQSVDLTLSVLKSMTVTSEITDSIWEELEVLCEPLKRISEVYPSPNTRSLAAEVHALLLTHGVVSRTRGATGCVPDACAAVGEGPSVTNGEPSCSVEGQEEAPPRTTKKETFDDAMKFILDPIMPVQVHGFLLLTKLLKAKDPRTLEHREEMLVLFMTAVRNADSYAYLAAIEGLATLADVFPDEIVPFLCKQYSDFEQLHPEGSDAGFEIRAKVGEALVRTIERLGAMAPKYAKDLLQSILFTCKKFPNADPFLRASAVTCLGHAVGQLKHGVGPHLQEVITCMEAMCRDSDAKVVQGSITGVRNMLEAWDDFPLENLRGMVKVFSQLNRSSSDPVILTLCRETFDLVQKRFSSLGRTREDMQKKLFITTPPPSAS
ncbi:unnamed protein product [Cyprideis torosa]|uniref:Uncharacterized protein n=1 Tax=Cyprideis torosa TaxID=163714 RepID=A0A7R8ZI23_9CRUS|nr:unnamed protein product [Cyprideis torosa]CAG0885090.1 unnamed protein product [Cyprideis torosa]